jgi:hypothetical protein
MKNEKSATWADAWVAELFVSLHPITYEQVHENITHRPCCHFGDSHCWGNHPEPPLFWQTNVEGA